MPVTAVVGANFGDEGKGRIVDVLASEYDYVIRYQGGANAGHTVLHDGGKFVFHQLPSGVFSHRATNVLGPGVALNLEKLCTELDMLLERGIGTRNWRFRIAHSFSSAGTVSLTSMKKNGSVHTRLDRLEAA